MERYLVAELHFEGSKFPLIEPRRYIASDIGGQGGHADAEAVFHVTLEFYKHGRLFFSYIKNGSTAVLAWQRSWEGEDFARRKDNHDAWQQVHPQCRLYVADPLPRGELRFCPGQNYVLFEALGMKEWILLRLSGLQECLEKIHDK